MTRIRLQAQIMPWEEPGSAAGARQQGVIKLCVPCLDSLTIQELADKITVQWDRIYVGYGSLDIKELKTVYNERLDMEETVGAYFDDRKDPDSRTQSNEPPANSIVRVYRLSPDPGELRNAVRHGSLMPESTARPRKRPRASFAQILQNGLYPVASIEERDNLPHKAFAVPNKRQRLHEARLSDGPTIDRQEISQAQLERDLPVTSQNSGTQGSIHQVYDSQGSAGGKVSNAYGTPTSLPLVSSQEPITRHQVDITSIPDSPTSRRAASANETYGETLSLDRERTKSESPEIRLSVHDVLHLLPQNLGKQTHTEMIPPSVPEASPGSDSRTQLRCMTQAEGGILEISGSEVQPQPQIITNSTRFSPIMQTSSAHPARAQVSQASIGPQLTTDNVFEIASDTESVHERQRLHSAKRLRSEPTSPALPDEVNTISSRLNEDESGGHTLESHRPDPEEDGAGISSSKLAEPNDKPIVETLLNGDEVAPIMRKPQAIPYNSCSDQLQGAPSSCNRSSSRRLDNDEGNAETKLSEAEGPSDETAVHNLQVSDLSAKNWSHLDVEHPLKRALSKGKRPDCSTLINVLNRDESGSNQGGSQDENDEELHKAEEEQKERERTREERAEHRRAAKEAKARQDEESGKRSSEKNLEERSIHERSLAKGAEEEKAKVEQLAEVERTAAAAKGKVEEVQSMQPPREAQAKGQRKSVKDRSVGKVVRKKPLKDNAVAGEASHGDGQLEPEDIQQQKTPASSSATAAAAKTPSSNKRLGRTEEQKQKRREMEAAKRQAKAGEARRTQVWAQSLFQTNNLSQHSSEHIDIDEEEEKPPGKRAKAGSSSQDTQKLRSSSSSRITGHQARDSMTPFLPNSTINEPASVQRNLTSSSLSQSTQLDTPLRSALKNNQNSNARRRSVTFVHGQRGIATTTSGSALDSSLVEQDVSSVRPFKTLVEINNDLALPTLAASKATQHAAIRNVSKGETTKDNVARRAMVQQKLNVARDKKLKGLIVPAHMSPSPAPKEEIIPSSGSNDADSVSSLEDDYGNGSAKAGPSSRKKRSRAVLSQDSVASFNLRGTPIDPAIERIDSQTRRSPLALHTSRSNTASSASSPQRSASRSPAQAMSETTSVSSGPASDSQSESEAGSEANSGSSSIKKVETSENRTDDSVGSIQLITTTSDINTKACIGEIKRPNGGRQKDQASRERGDSSINVNGHKAAEDEAAGQQLQLECSPLMNTRLAKAISPSGDGHAPYDKLLNQGLDRNGRLPDGTRPAYWTHPKLSTLRKLPKALTWEAESSALSASQGLAITSARDRQSSSPSSEESSSTTEDDEDDEGDDDDDNDEVNGEVKLSSHRTSSKLKSGLKNAIQRKPKVLGAQQLNVC